VLAERGGTGHAPNFARVRFDGAAPAPGVIADTIITGLGDSGLTAILADRTA